jgi:hypothetical protein
MRKLERVEALVDAGLMDLHLEGEAANRHFQPTAGWESTHEGDWDYLVLSRLCELDREWFVTTRMAQYHQVLEVGLDDIVSEVVAMPDALSPFFYALQFRLETVKAKSRGIALMDEYGFDIYDLPGAWTGARFVDQKGSKTIGIFTSQNYIASIPAEIRQFAQEAVQKYAPGESSVMQKVIAVQKYVGENIRYEKNVNWDPIVVLRNRVGNCSGRSALMDKMVGSLGIYSNYSPTSSVYPRFDKEAMRWSWDEAHQTLQVLIDNAYIIFDSTTEQNGVIISWLGSFAPVTISRWAERDVTQAVYWGRFVPVDIQSNFKQAITREEFAILAVTMYEKLLGTKIEGRVEFSDTDDVAVQKAAFLGLVEGTGGTTFSPDAPLTREQAAALLSRLAAALGVPLDARTPQFSDMAGVSDWARTAVSQMWSMGIMGGVDGAFSPKGSYTREQAIVSAFRLYNKAFVQMFPDSGMVSYLVEKIQSLEPA